jgi:DnaJ-domain-containing protein 1
MIFYYLLLGVILALVAHLAFGWMEKQSEEDRQRYKAWAARGSIAGILMMLLRVRLLRAGTWMGLLTLLLPFLLGKETQNPSSASPPPSSSSGMTREEAAKILGVRTDAAPEEIEKAWRRLMQRAHPDAGGSDYLATQINRAREILVKKRS